MKKVFVLVVAFVATGLFAKAQCDGVTKWNCTKMKIVDQSGNVVNEKEDNIVVLVSNKNITVTPGDDSQWHRVHRENHGHKVRRQTRHAPPGLRPFRRARFHAWYDGHDFEPRPQRRNRSRPGQGDEQ